MSSAVDKGDTDKFVTNESGHKLYCKYWSEFAEDAPKPRALLFLNHGLGEHCLYYEEIALLLTKEGFYVFSHDHQGHGQSEGPRFLIKDVREFTRDVFMHIELVKEKFPDLPVFILGHSMGGAITILCAMDRPDYFKGVALLSPLVTPDSNGVGSCRIFFGKLLARLCPSCPVVWLKACDMSRDQSICKKYEDDPLNSHGGLKAGTGLALLQATMEIESKLPTVEWPFFVVHGGHDVIVPPCGSKKLFEQAASKDKTLKMYEDCFHQIQNELEPNKSEMLEELRKWLSQRIS